MTEGRYSSLLDPTPAMVKGALHRIPLANMSCNVLHIAARRCKQYAFCQRYARSTAHLVLLGGLDGDPKLTVPSCPSRLYISGLC